MSSPFKHLVNVGVTGLDDPSPLQTPRQWFRNGERGNLHIDRHCYKLSSWSSASVDLTHEQAAKKKVCANCTDERALPHTLELPLKVLHNVGTIFASFDEKLTSAKFAQDLGGLLEQLEQIRGEISRLDDDQRDLVSGALAQLDVRLAQAAQATTALRDRLADGLVAWAASRLMLGDGHELVKAPGVLPSDVTLFGIVHERYNVNEQLRNVYGSWVRARKRGREHADTGALDVAASLELTDIAQLDFPVEHSSSSSLLTLAKERWRDETRRRLTQRLFPAWDEHWCAYVTRTEPRTVGLTSSPVQDATRGILESYPRHGNIAVMPEVVALWVTRTETRYGNPVAVMAPGCDPELLQTVAVLWDHHNGSSPYHRLDDAITAAQAV